jgi:transcriptional regulator with XRE-family HTH domain
MPLQDSSGVPQGLSEEQAEVYRLTVVNRLTQREIASRMDLSQQRVSQILADARAKLPPVDLEAIRRESLELHLKTQRAALELAEMRGAPVTAGKDGDIVRDDDGSMVRDYSLRLAALEQARKADVEIRKLHGLDAAQKVDVTGAVRYEVAGVDISKLS